VKKRFVILSAVALGVGGVLVILWPRCRGREDFAHLGTPPASVGSAVPGRTPGPQGGLDVVGAASQPRGSLTAKGRVVVQGRWGSGAGEFGRKEAQESNPEAPMSFFVTPSGEILVLDQVNGRIQRFGSDGKPRGEVKVYSETVQDLAVDGQGNLLVLDRLVESELTIYSPDGQPQQRIPVVGGPIREGGAITGVFSDPTGTYLEREHTESVRVAKADGTPDPDRPNEPGRPTRDGQHFLWAAIGNRKAGVVHVRVFDREARLVWARAVSLPRSLVHLLLLDSDRRGFVYVGGLVGDEAGPELVNLGTAVVRLRLSDGGQAGMLMLPANTSADEVFRELFVGDDGAIYQMIPSKDGLTVTRYDFP